MTHVDTRTFNVLSLCSGIGGLELGLKRAVPDARTVCFVEREAYCCEVLATRMEDEVLDDAPIWTDLLTFDGRPWRGVVDCITAGYPCQPFSTAGKKLGDQDERHLWPHVARVINEVKPPFVFCENVDRHLSVGFGEVSAELEEMGYVVAAGLFTANEVGAAHKRRRLFFVAHSTGAGSQGLWSECGLGQSGEEGETQWGSNELGFIQAQRLSGRFTERHGNSQQVESSSQPDWPVFAPGPDALDEWAYLLSVMSEVEPALCRDAHGITA